MNKNYISVDGVLNDIDNLIHLGHLQTVIARNPHLSGQEPADGH